MQHIFNIAIDVDDERIRKAVEENAEKAIIEKVTGDVEEALFSHRGWSSEHRNPRNRMGQSQYLTDLILEFLDNNKEEIINLAAKELAGRLIRTKRGKEILNEV